MDGELRLETLVDTDCVRVGCWRSLFIQLWTGSPMAFEQELVTGAFETMIGRHGEAGFVTLSILSMSQLPSSPEAGVRERSRAQFAMVDPYVRVSAIVFELSGFGARSIKTFMKALLLLTRPQADTRTFDGVDDGLDWLVAHAQCEDAFAAKRSALGQAIIEWRHN